MSHAHQTKPATGRFGKRAMYISLVAILGLVSVVALSVGAAGQLGAERFATFFGPPPNADKPMRAAPAQPSKLLPAGPQTVVAPQSGWLYVLDTNNAERESQVLLVDPTANSVQRTFRVGYAPEMALSLDGTRLYVISGSDGGNTLHVFDTTTGATLQSVAVTDRQMYTFRPVLPNIALSPDSSALYVLKLRTPTPGNDQISLAKFDTAKGTFGPDQPLAGCMGAALVTSGDQVAVLCAGSHQLRVIAGGKNAGAEATITLPSNASANASEQAVARASAAVPAANGTFVVVLGNGQIYNVGGSGQSIQSEIALNQSSDLWVPHGNVAASADGSKLFVGLGAVAERGQRASESIVILDAKTGEQISSVKPSQPFWSMSVDHSGSQIYTVHPEQQSITVIDVSTQQAVTTLRNLGVSPVQVAIAP